MFRELTVGESALLTDLAMCINYYRLFTPGVYCCIHVPVQLDDETRITPGVIAQVNHGIHKQSEPGPDYVLFRGPPNFVLDVFPHNEVEEYERRRDAYERSGVIEYVALWDTDPLEWKWNRLRDGTFELVETSDEEFIGSTALPGLWMRTSALRRRDWWTIMGNIARGVSRDGHHELMQTIWKAGRSSD